MVKVEYDIQDGGNRPRQLSAQKVSTRSGRPSWMTFAIGAVAIALVVALQMWLQQRGEATADAPSGPPPMADYTRPDRVADNGLALPPRTAREREEVSMEELRANSLPATWIDEERVQVGEVSWSDENPRVRINHFWHRIGDRVKGIDEEYTVVQIRRDRVYLRHAKNGRTLHFTPGALHGINNDLMTRYRLDLEKRLPEDERQPGDQ